jgi:hypothetical protein
MKNLFVVAAVAAGCVLTMHGMSPWQQQQLEEARVSAAIRGTSFPASLTPAATTQGLSVYQQQVLSETIVSQITAKK